MTLFFQIAHTKPVKKSDFVTDMAVDALEKHSLASLAAEKELQYGIVRKVVNLREAELARRIGRERGVYVTFDCPPVSMGKDRAVRALKSYIANTLVEMVGVMGRKSKVLVVGLGNDEVTADSLGCRTVRMLDVSAVSEAERPREKARLCAMTTGVEGTTGIRSADTVEGVCAKIKPSCVIAVDSLATASVGRIGASFQLTTAGIAPGSGVGGDKARIDRSVLGVPVVAVGVPLVLSMRTLLRSFTEEYTAAVGCNGDEFRLREIMVEKRLGNLVVAPKEVKYYVERAAALIAGAINAAFGEHGGKTC